MSTVFIGWGGNENLAKELEEKLKNEGYKYVHGGGLPNQMFVGKQIIDQMKTCDRAILLVEEYKNSGISTNLMYEWGYLVGYKRIKHIHAYLIDKPKSDLPSDLGGVWAEEITRKGDDGKLKDDGELAAEICNKFIESCNREPFTDYFDIINKWQYISRDLENDENCLYTTEFIEYIVIGCLAAYYYNDNERFRNSLDNISGKGRLGDIISFAKIYVDVFLESGNMSCALDTDKFIYAQNIKQRILKRKRETVNNIPSVLDDIVDILCYDILGLINLLNLKRKDLDDQQVKQYSEEALNNFKTTLEKIGNLNERFGDTNECLICLLQSYIYNDMAHLYDIMGDGENYKECLEQSVANRFDLLENFKNEFPTNKYLSDKLHQEFYIAFSEQCLITCDAVGLQKAKTQYEKWEQAEKTRRTSEFTNHLLLRLKANVAER